MKVIMLSGKKDVTQTNSLLFATFIMNIYREGVLNLNGSWCFNYNHIFSDTERTGTYAMI